MNQIKTILAFGDSLTWGRNARLNQRHAYEDRWPSRLEAGLEGRARVIAEGLRGRTTAADVHLAAADRNGASVLPTLLDTHSPLDLVIIMLGTNDLMSMHRWTALQSSHGMRRLIQIVQGYFAAALDADLPQIIVVSPPHVGQSENPDLENQPWRDVARAQSRELAQRYRAIADLHGAGFWDAASVAKADPYDGVHLDAANSRAIGDGLIRNVQQILSL